MIPPETEHPFPTPEEWTEHSFNKQMLDQLEEVYKRDKRRPVNQSFTGYIENMFRRHIDYTEKLERFGSFIQYLDADQKHIYLMNHRKPKSHTVVVEVKEDTKELFCEDDKSTYCTHVGFCYGVKEVYDVLINRGFRPPKEEEIQ